MRHHTHKPYLWVWEKLVEVWQCRNDSIFLVVGKVGRDKGHAHNSTDASHEVIKSNLVIGVSMGDMYIPSKPFYYKWYPEHSIIVGWSGSCYIKNDGR